MLVVFQTRHATCNGSGGRVIKAIPDLWTLRRVKTMRVWLTLADVVNAYGHAEELRLGPDVCVELDLFV